MHSPQRERYDQQGYVILPAFFDTSVITQFQQLVLPIYQQWIAQTQHYDFFADLVNMHSLTLPEYFQSSPAQRLQLFNLLASPALVDVMTELFGEGLYFHNTQLFFNPRDLLKQNYWHRDLQYSDIPDEQQQALHHQLVNLHVRIPLLDETGLELIPHSHTQWDTPLEFSVRFAKDGHTQHDELPDSQLISLKQGDVLIFNAQMIHRGRYEFNAERLALDLCIGQRHAQMDAFMDGRVQPTVEELAHIQCPQWFCP